MLYDLVERLMAMILTAADTYEQRCEELEAHMDAVHRHPPLTVLLCKEELKWWQHSRRHPK
ncbi:hypothetical protein [Vibrio superstes]|uniref:Uncharacterized protein n=1 Tax=Vibrio superstes NBRC 103154 TaxID=1219062 RepID=A0A511QSI7_9VIBR|nr:hypothetical protein [Vibrio superstes]GEM79826.1 hypothetical protein VSU01S_20710 [Vibrio superstes NBRC 103154]